MIRLKAVALSAAGMLALAACSTSTADQDASQSPGQQPNRAVVLVSGTASTTPFTTPTEACASGLSAGNTYAFIRDALVKEGFAVYTQPVSPGGTVVPATSADADWGYGECPQQLPADVTINSIDSPVTGGEQMAAFLLYLHEKYQVDEVDLVAHSLGGIFVRNGIADMEKANSPVKVRSLTTLGSPWEPVMPANPPYKPKEACDGSQVCEAFVEEMMKVPSAKAIVSALTAKEFVPWSNAQAGVLDDVPVTLVAGDYFTKPMGNPDKWPNDGIVQLSAATARSVPDSVLPIRSCFITPTTHSAFISKEIGDSLSTGLTWNDTTVGIIANAARTAGTPEQLANRLGCPTP